MRSTNVRKIHSLTCLQNLCSWHEFQAVWVRRILCLYEHRTADASIEQWNMSLNAFIDDAV